MIKVGEYNELEVSKEREFGYFLKDFEGDEVLLPKSLAMGQKFRLGEKVTVFVYLDSTERQVATMKKPIIAVGEVGYLEVITQNDIGAFFNNNIGKDLFVPFKEQRFKVLQGKKYLISAYIDKSGRIAGTTDVDQYLDRADIEQFKVNDMVECIAYARSEGGSVKVAIDGKYTGIILHNEHDTPIYPGDAVKARVKRVYEDGNVGLSTRKKRLDARDELKEKIILELKKNGGFMEFNDKSSPEQIKETFNTSKNYFKMTLGNLMKEGIIKQGKEGTTLIK